MAERKVVLITGASSGIGRSIARLLAEEGFAVFGTSRDASGSRPLSDGVMLSLDVREDPSVRNCLDTILERTGRLDVVVNSAGYPLAGAAEEANLEQVKALFETNFFGVVRMVKAVLPVMRRQGSGQIINISSGMAQARVPFVGLYSASKCALEGYSEALWHELRPLNIRVCVIRPGFFGTNIGRNMHYGEDRVADYDPWREPTLQSYRESLQRGADPVPVARCVLRIIRSRNPSLYYAVGKDARGVSFLRRWLPHATFGRLIRRLIGFGRVGA